MAVAFIAQTVASAVIGMVVEKVASILEVGRYFKGRELDHESRQKLRIVLISAKAVLIDAEMKQISNPAVKEWVRELTDAVYVAEDLIDKMDTEASRCQSTAETQTRKRKYYNFISGLVDLFGKGSTELENILQRLEYITQQKHVLGLIEVVATSHPLPNSNSEEREVYVYWPTQNPDSEETKSEDSENSDFEEKNSEDSEEETNSEECSADNDSENFDSEETNSEDGEEIEVNSEEIDENEVNFEDSEEKEVISEDSEEETNFGEYSADNDSENSNSEETNSKEYSADNEEETNSEDSEEREVNSARWDYRLGKLC